MTDFSAHQTYSGLAVGDMATRESPAMPATPDVAGTVGPPAQTAEPWPGRGEAQQRNFDEAAGVFASLAAQAYNAPGSLATTAVTGGVPNGMDPDDPEDEVTALGKAY